ncbi:MAG TPA: 5-(carboxyamino)imidazole ribonucleotide synthase [Candidatus Dormibacteraeota bacterium]|nr:5-(carboxyamino)imidazole ribonucleotide synthase [Candidatus Dormibacteraeota bacterium]
MTIGILGGGQLGYMLALAGYPLGLRFRFLDPSPEAPVGRIAQRITAAFDDHSALDRFAAGLEAVTYEFENVPVDTTRFLSQRVPVFPPSAALEEAQHRVREKNLFQKLAIATTGFAPVPTPDDLDAALKKIPLPAILKTCRMGYDGKGQWILRTPEDVARAKSDLSSEHLDSAKNEAALILERFVPFSRELSIIAVRSRSGETAFYPLIENHHRCGILRLSIAPAPRLSPALQQAAEVAARSILETLNYVGVLCIEFFEVQGRLLANEMAPRVHNSGHWTIEGAVTSQFENHLRAILDLPLGSTAAPSPCAMLNLIGDVPDPREALALPDAHLHLYGKESRPGRKLGHLTIRAADFDALRQRLAALPKFFHRPEFCLEALSPTTAPAVSPATH